MGIFKCYLTPPGCGCGNLNYEQLVKPWISMILDDRFVVALSTKDDGYVITSAKIIAIEVATGKITELTDDSVLVDGLAAVEDKIVYTTEEGEMYVMNILINE